MTNDAPSARRSLDATGVQPSSGDDRPDSRRDHDRIFYALEFARLEGITQVATVFSSGIHNRLTHSYRVEQVARSIVLRVNSRNSLTIDEDAVAAAALAHDIGHSPFGHTGEEALQRLLVCDFHRSKAGRTTPDERRDKQYWRSCTGGRGCILPDSFEGNAQSFRILTLLAPKVPEYTDWGLDLQRITLQASLKYPWLKGENPSKPEKWGAYDCDADVLKWAEQGAAGGQLEQSLEAQIMDTADDIAYAVHDIEDFWEAGIIRLGDLQVGSSAFDEIMGYVAQGLDADGDGILAELHAEWRSWHENRASASDQQLDDKAVAEALAGAEAPEALPLASYPLLSDLQGRFDQLTRSTYDDSLIDRGLLTRLRSTLITTFIGSLQVQDGKLGFDDERVRNYMEFLKKLTWFYVISSPDFTTIRRGQAKVMQACFDELLAIVEEELLEVSGAKKSIRNLQGVRGVEPRLLDYVRLAIGRRGEYSDREVLARAVVDYICSLTDAETYSLAGRISGSASSALPGFMASYRS